MNRLPTALKIGEAAKRLGVSTKTLRRWEKSGKISSTRTPLGTRLYSLDNLQNFETDANKVPLAKVAETFGVSTRTIRRWNENGKLKAQKNTSGRVVYSPEIIQKALKGADSVPTTEELLNKHSSEHALPEKNLIDFDFYQIPQSISKDNINIKKSLMMFGGFLVFLILTTAGIIAYPKRVQILSLFQIKNIPIVKTIADVRNADSKEKISDVLAATTGEITVKINANEHVTGNLTVDKQINGVTMTATSSGIVLTDPATGRSLTVGGTGNINISQSFDGTTTATVPGLNLTGTSNQITMGSGANTGTITWTPTGTQTITFPNSTGTAVLDSATQTLTNKTISGSSNTLSNIGNSALTNSSITVTAGTGLSGGGSVSLGGSVTLNSSGGGVTSISNSDGSLTISPTSGAAIASLNLANSNTWTGTTTTFSGNVGIGGSLTVTGNLIGPATGTLGYFSRSGTTISTTTAGDSLSLTGPATIAPNYDAVTALTLRSAPSGTNDIFDITSNDGTSTYFSVDSSGQLSGSAFRITDVNNAIVGTAIEGQWSFNSATFTYRRQITVNNTSASTLPKNYEISVALSGTNASQVYTNTRTDYNDLQVAYDTGTQTEIARNVSSHTSSSVAFTFQLQADITAGQSATNYYIYYKSPNLASPAALTYTGSHQLESMDTTTGWTSGSTGLVISADSSSPQEGSASLKAQAVIDKMGTFATTNQGQLAEGLTELAALTTTSGGTNYVYAIGGNNGSDVSTVYKSSITSNNLGAFSTASQGQLPQNLSGATTVSASSFDAGTGALGALDLTDGTGCSGTGLTWTNGTGTCTITATGTYNFTTITIPTGKILTTNSGIIPTIKATGAVSITGTINLDAKGYTAGLGDRPGTSGASSAVCGNVSGGGGGGYGGTGGTGGSTVRDDLDCTDSTGPSSGGGTISSQLALGSGGGNGQTAGGTGGGAVKIVSAGNITINAGGIITANGSNGSNNGGGGGSGGSIILQSPLSISNSGTIRANGGNGGTSFCGYYDPVQGPGGGGGGGLITIQDSDGSVGGTVTASGGNNASACDSSQSSNTWSTGTATAGGTYTVTPGAITINTYLYVLGGKNGGSYQSTVYQSLINSTTGNLGAFATTGQTQLPQALYGHTSLAQLVNGSNYLYVLGGNNGTTDVNTVYKSTIDGGTGNIGAWSTASQGQLPQNLSEHAQASIAISGTTYVYIIGGKNGATSQTTVYKAAINSLTGDMGAFSAVSQGQLPVALYGASAAVGASSGINYLYVIGGNNGSSNVDTAYRAVIDASGNIGTFSTLGQAQLPSALSGHQTVTNTVSGTTYFYTLGGTNGSPISTVYRSTIDSSITGYTVTKTFSSTDFSKYNDISFYAKSDSAGSYLTFALQTGGSSWQTPCAFSVTGSFGLKTCDITGITRTGVTGYRFSSSSTTDFIANFDDIEILTNSATITNTAAGGSAVLGAANLAVNAQGSGMVLINYGDAYHTAAGTGGLTVFNGLTTSLLKLDSTGNLGIGGSAAVAPIAQLDLRNSNTGTGLHMYVGSSAGQFSILDNGNVGIGTSAPAFQLQTTGNVGIGKSLTVTSAGVFNSSLAVTGNTQLSTLTASGLSRLNNIFTTGNVGIGATTSSNKLDVWGNANITGNLTVSGNLIGPALGTSGYFTRSGTSLTTSTIGDSISTIGNVGVGTTSPIDFKLEVAGNVGPTSNNTFTLGSTTLRWADAFLGPGSLHIGTSTSDEGVLSYNTTNNNLTLNSTGSVTFQSTGGNVGIGTTNPNYKLDINGVINATSLYQNGSPIAASQWTTAGSDISFSTGNIGIGTTSPTAKLDVFGGINLSNSASTTIGTSVYNLWTMNSNIFNYRKAITITNNDGSNPLPAGYQVSVTVSGSDATHLCANSRSDKNDVRLAYGSTEIARNLTNGCTTSVDIAFQLQADIPAGGSSSIYYIYYNNSTLSSAAPTFVGNIQVDSMDSVGSWTSNNVDFPISQEAANGSKTYTTLADAEGTGSIKSISNVVNHLDAFTTTNQGQLLQGVSKLASVPVTIGATTNAYILGGNTGSADITNVYKAALSGGNIGVGTTASQGQLPQPLSGLTVATVTALDAGAGGLGALDLTDGTGCSGTGLTWTIGTSTCTITITGTYEFTSINIPVGTILTADAGIIPTLKSIGNVTIAGTVNLDGKGSAARTGTHKGGDGNYRSSPAIYAGGGGGGGYGGGGGGGGYVGGQITQAAGGTTDTDPLILGSGGGCGGNNVGCGGAGGAGGGSIKIVSGGNITLSGSITALGSNGGTSPAGGGGGGSGGGVYLQAKGSVTGGTINAKGGLGAGASTSCSGGSYLTGGGGGGGRITLEDSDGSIAGTFTAAAGGTNTTNGCSGAAGAGTAFTPSPAIVTLNYYLYALGGKNGANTQSTVYRSTIDNATKDLGAFATTNQTQLTEALSGHTSFISTTNSNDYIYVLGGNNGTNDVSTVYKALLTSGNIGTLNTAGQGQLPQALSEHAQTTLTISGTTYVYVLGGKNTGTPQTTVYKATIDGSGNIGAFSTASQGQLPVALSGATAVTYTTGGINYIDVLGGNNGSSAVSTVYKAIIDASGNIGSFSTNVNSLPQALSSQSTFGDASSGTPYFYVLGGTNTSSQSTVYRTGITTDMTGYSATRTITSTDLSNKNNIQFKFYSSSTAAGLMELAFSENGSSWQTTTFGATSPNTWETKTWDISGIASGSRDAVTYLRFRINSTQGSAVTAYLDDIQGLINATIISNSTSALASALGGINLTLNAQGTGIIALNYDATNSLAGTGGLTLYNGGTTSLFTIDSTGNVGIGTSISTNKFQVTGGNVGIGVTSSISTLAVNGNSTIGWGVTGIAGPTNGLAIAGNMGIGTTSPLAPLQVQGNNTISALFLNGNVGIGFTSPDRTLQLASDINITSSLSTLLGTNGTQFSVTGSSTSGLTDKLVLGIDTTDHYGVIQAGTAASAYNLSLNPAGGNVGIGTTSPENILDIQGNLTFGVGSGSQRGILKTDGANASVRIIYPILGAVFIQPQSGTGAKAQFGGTTVEANTLFYLNNNGNVGVGSTTSSNKLDVWGNSRITGTLTLDSSLTSLKGLFGYTSGTALSAGAVTGFNGNVGIGTTNPNAKLSFSANTTAAGGIDFGGDVNLYRSSANVLATSDTLEVAGDIQTGNNFKAVSNSQILNKAGNNWITWATRNTSGTEAVYDLSNIGNLYTSGNIGIGNTSPSQLFQINNNSSNPFVITSGGSVGIGTTSPVDLLDIRGSSEPMIRVTNTGMAGAPYLQIGMNNGNNAALFQTSAGKDVKFWNGQYALTILGASGNVGINTQSPGAKFDVNADCSNFQTTHQCTDYAEYYPSSEPVDTGEILVIDNVNSPEQIVKKSNSPYQQSIIGIVSTNPAVVIEGNSVQLMTGAEYTPNPMRPAVALAGRVPLKVSTENGPIQKGDYLTSSSTSGVAMKATRPGQVVGKALEEFKCPERPEGVEGPPSTNAQGDTFCNGKILVFVNVSFADPGNFLANLSLDSDGNLIIPKIKTGSLILDPSIASPSSQLTANNGQLALNPGQTFDNPGPNTATNTNQFIDLSGKIASLEDRILSSESRIKDLEDKVATQAAILAEVKGIEATSSATPSASVILASDQNPSATDSGVANAPQNDNLNLTPPDLLLATGSATLANINITSEATVSGMLTAYGATIQQTFKSLGQTTLGNTLVAGDLTVDGTMSINGNSVNSISTLYLQNNPLSSSIDIFNQAITMDKSGNINTTGEITTKKINIKQTAGQATLPGGQTQITVANSLVTNYSLIFITPVTVTDQILSASQISPNQDFTVTIKLPAKEDIKFNWWIIN